MNENAPKWNSEDCLQIQQVGAKVGCDEQGIKVWFPRFKNFNGYLKL